MQREIDTLKTDNSLLEETILKTLEAIDQASKVRQQEQHRVTDAQARLRTESERIERELADITEQVADLERHRQSLAPEVPPATLVTYDQILRLRDGLALVPLMSSACGGCHRRLQPQVINEVYLKAKLVTCENCNRILYFDEAHSKL